MGIARALLSLELSRGVMSWEGVAGPDRDRGNSQLSLLIASTANVTKMFHRDPKCSHL